MFNLLLRYIQLLNVVFVFKFHMTIFKCLRSTLFLSVYMAYVSMMTEATQTAVLCLTSLIQDKKRHLILVAIREYKQYMDRW